MQIDGNHSKEVIFGEIVSLLTQLQEEPIKSGTPLLANKRYSSETSANQVDLNIPELNHEMVGMHAVKENWIWIGGSSMLECPRTLQFSLNTASTHYLHLGASCTNANLP
ncbi:hypothetical protein LINPERHAP2_LOCUS23497 [Linum perenne]